jgi:iron(III) transport system substrate-binding protein
MRRPFSLIARLLMSVMGVIFIAACGTIPASTPTIAPTIAPAGAAQPTAVSATSGNVVIYTSRAEALFKPVIAAFNLAYPDITVTVLNGSNGELAAKLLEEQANPKADVLVNSDTLTMASLDTQGLFAANDSPTVMAVSTDYRSENGSWVALTLRPRVIMYNTELVTPEELPTSILDLADPRWKGQIGSADSRNGALMANLVAIRHLAGNDTLVRFVQGLTANETAWFGGHTEVRKAVGAGELKLGFVNHYYYHLSKAEGAPVGIIYPDQGSDQSGLVVNSTNAGIIRNAPNPAAARLFVDFMLSSEGQRIYAEQNFEYPIIAGVALAEGVPPLSEFRLADVTFKTMWSELEPTKAEAQAAGLP